MESFYEKKGLTPKKLQHKRIIFKMIAKSALNHPSKIAIDHALATCPNSKRTALDILAKIDLLATVILDFWAFCHGMVNGDFRGVIKSALSYLFFNSLVLKFCWVSELKWFHYYQNELNLIRKRSK